MAITSYEEFARAYSKHVRRFWVYSEVRSYYYNTQPTGMLPWKEIEIVEHDGEFWTDFCSPDKMPYRIGNLTDFTVCTDTGLTRLQLQDTTYYVATAVPCQPYPVGQVIKTLPDGSLEITLTQPFVNTKKMEKGFQAHYTHSDSQAEEEKEPESDEFRLLGQTFSKKQIEKDLEQVDALISQGICGLCKGKGCEREGLSCERCYGTGQEK